MAPRGRPRKTATQRKTPAKKATKLTKPESEEDGDIETLDEIKTSVSSSTVEEQQDDKKKNIDLVLDKTKNSVESIHIDTMPSSKTNGGENDHDNNVQSDEDEKEKIEESNVEKKKESQTSKSSKTTVDQSKKSSLSAKKKSSSNTKTSKSSTKKSAANKADHDEKSMKTKNDGKPMDDSKAKSSKAKTPEKSDRVESSNDSEDDDNDREKSKEDYDVEYFKRMYHRTQDRFHDPTDKELFIDNLWKNIQGKELKLSYHKYPSSCISWLIENGDDKVLKTLSEKIVPEQAGFSVDFLLDQFTFTVVETFFEVFIRKLSREDSFETSTSKWIIKWLESFGKFIIDNIPHLLKDTGTFGNRLLIITIEAIGGIRIGRHWSRKTMRFGSVIKTNLEGSIENDMAFKELPGNFKHHLKKLAKVLVLDNSDENIRDNLFGRCTNVAQYLLFVLKVRYPELCQMVVKNLVEIAFASEQSRDTITQSASGAYIIEILLLVASESRLSKMWTKHLKGNLQVFWKHDIANFIVQRLIAAIKEEKLFADVCEEIFPDLADIFKSNRPGIGVCLSKACQDFKNMQIVFVTALLKAFDCFEPKNKQMDLVRSMLFFECRFKRATGYNRSNVSIWLHGSLMLQYLMDYQDPYKISKSLLSMTINEILQVCKDRSGSHVIDSFFRSETVKINHKSELVERFLGHYCTLSMDKFGSRIVENIMALSNEQVKSAILTELSQYESELKSNRNGWFVAKNTGLFHFKNRQQDWRDVERSKNFKRKRDFSDEFSPVKKPFRPSGGGDGDRRFGGFGGGDRGFKHMPSRNHSPPSHHHRQGNVPGRFRGGAGGMGKRF